jgi:basic membrane protein A and related proteins
MAVPSPHRRRRPLPAVVLAAAMLVVPVVAAATGGVETDTAGRVAKADLDRAQLVTVRALNVRADPSTANPSIGLLQEGEAVLELERTFNTEEGRDWRRVQLPGGGEGWIAGAFVVPVAPGLDTLEAAMRLVAGFAASSDAPAAEPAAGTLPAMPEISAGFVHVGPVGDAGWTFQHDQGRQALEALPFVVATGAVENVPEDPALVEAAIEELVAAGHNLVFTTSYGFMDPTIEAARRHPEIAFMHASGFKTAPNSGTYFGRMYEARYLAGILAGGMTASGIIGYVAAFPIPEVVRQINAFTLGAQSVNPDVEVRVVWTDTWYGPGIEREAAERLLDFGADVLTMHQDSPAVVQAAEQRGKFAIGFHSDMGMFAPTASLASAVWNWQPLYETIATDLHEGSFRPEQYWWGLEEGVVDLVGINPLLPGELVERVDAARASMLDGSLRLFAGPIRDADGVVWVPSGSIPSDAELLTMDYFVLGVKGDLPTPQPAAGPLN